MEEPDPCLTFGDLGLMLTCSYSLKEQMKK